MCPFCSIAASHVAGGGVSQRGCVCFLWPPASQTSSGSSSTRVVLGAHSFLSGTVPASSQSKEAVSGINGTFSPRRPQE